MTHTEKGVAIEQLKEKIANSEFFYITDASTMSVADVNRLRRLLFDNGIEMQVVKNTIARKAMEALPEDKNYAPLFDVLHGPSALLFTSVANLPARTIKKFREGGERPVLKAAYIDSAIYKGDDQLDALSKLKSKEEMLGELLGLLQSPMSNLLGALGSGGSNVMGLLKALEERGE